MIMGGTVESKRALIGFTVESASAFAVPPAPPTTKGRQSGKPSVNAAARAVLETPAWAGMITRRVAKAPTWTESRGPTR